MVVLTVLQIDTLYHYGHEKLTRCEIESGLCYALLISQNNKDDSSEHFLSVALRLHKTL